MGASSPKGLLEKAFAFVLFHLGTFLSLWPVLWFRLEALLYCLDEQSLVELFYPVPDWFICSLIN